MQVYLKRGHWQSIKGTGEKQIKPVCGSAVRKATPAGLAALSSRRPDTRSAVGSEDHFSTCPAGKTMVCNSF